MNKFLSRIAKGLLGLSLAAGGLVAVLGAKRIAEAKADVEAVTFSQQGYTNQQEIASYVGTHFSIAFAKGTNSNVPKYYTSGSAIRAYGGNTITVSSSDTLSKIIWTFGSSDGSNSISTDVGSYTNGTWSGSASEVVFTIGGSSGNRRLAGVEVTYSSGGTPVVEEKYTVEFNANVSGYDGSTPSPITQSAVGASITLPAALSFEGYEWVGWNTIANGGSSTRLEAGSSFVPATNVTLYGEWKEIVANYIDDGSAITWDLSKDTTDTATDSEISWTSPKVTMIDTKGTASTATNNYYPGTEGKTYTSTRFYKGSDFQITPVEGYKVTSIVATATSESYATAFKNSTWTNASASADASVVTVTPEDESEAVSASIGATCGFTRFVVNYVAKTSAQLSSIAISGTYETSFKQGDEFTHDGLIVTATYSDSSESVVTSKAIFDGYDMATVGQQTVIVSYTEGEVTKTASYQITVNEALLLAVDDVALYEGDADFAPVVKIKDTTTVVSGCAFTSSNTSVISIVDGKLHIVAPGVATVVASHEDANNKSYSNATFKVYVAETIQKVVELCIPLGSGDTLSGTHTIRGTVTGLYGNSFMIQHGDYGMYIYSSSARGVELNDVVQITGTFKRYRNWFETASVTSVEKLAFATPEVPAPLVVSNPSLLEDKDQNRLVSFLGLTWVSGTYSAVGTNSSITFKDSDDNQIVYYTDKYIADDVETAIKAKIDVISADEGKTYVVDLVGAHYTVHDSDKQFKITNADVISFREKEATDQSIVDQFVEEKLRWTTYDPSHTEGQEGANECLGNTGYYIQAKNAFQLLTERQQNLFRHLGEFASQDDLYEAPRARYEAWAKAYGDETPYAATVTPIAGSNFGLVNVSRDGNSAVVLVVIVSLISVSSLTVLLVIKRRRVHQ